MEPSNPTQITLTGIMHRFWKLPPIKVHCAWMTSVQHSVTKADILHWGNVPWTDGTQNRKENSLVDENWVVDENSVVDGHGRLWVGS